MIPSFFLGGVQMQGAKWDSVDDPYWSSVTLLLRMDGADASTTFNDSSSLGISCAATTGYSVSNTQSKTGGTSCKSVGTGRLRGTNVSASEMSGDFTAEAWCYWTATPTTSSSPFGLYRSGGFYLNPGMWTDNKLYLGNTGGDVIVGTTAVSRNAWYHIAVTRSGSTVRMWLDGAQEGSTYTTSSTFCTNGQFTYIGSANDGGNIMGFSTTAAYVDLVRITKADRYGTSSFTPAGDY